MEVKAVGVTELLAVLDNKLVQHGRMAYRGNRRHLAALAMHPPN